VPDTSESHEFIGFYYFEEGIKINVIPPKGPEKEFEFPIFPKGKAIPGQDDGCLMVPRYSGT
jgi:hypothetical protein